MKWLQVCLLVALVAASSTMELGHLQPRAAEFPRIYEDKILEKIKQYIKSGIPELGVPPMDPLQLRQEIYFPKISYHDVAEFDKLMIRNTRVEGIGNFQKNKIALELTGLSGFDLEIDLSWNSLKAKGDRYAFFASLLGVEFTGAGNYEVELRNVRAILKVSLRSNVYGQLYVSAVELGPLIFEELKSNMKGLVEDGHVSDVMNESVHLLAERIWYSAQPALAAFANQLTKDLANEELEHRKITMEDVIKWLGSQS